MIPAIVLAAGLSTRMGGQSKALLSLPDGRTFVRAIVETFLAADVDDVVIVVGHESATVVDRLVHDGVNARWVMNANYRTGQFSSLLAGLDAVDRPGVEAMLMTLVDVPRVSVATVRSVLARFKTTGAPIVRPVRGHEHGHPVLIARALFGTIRSADAAAGAKPIVRAHVSPAGDVEVDDDGAFRDVDTPETYATFLSRP